MKLADISKYQGIIDYDKLNIDGLIIRAGYRGYSNGIIVTDNKLNRNMTEAGSHHIPYALYFYSQAINENEAIDEAEFLINKADTGKDIMFLAIDMEMTGSGMGRADNLSPEQRQIIRNAFCKTIKEAGYTAVVYSNENYFVKNLNTRSPHYINWVRNWSKEPLIEYRIWQYTNKGKIPGINVDVDLNKTEWTFNDFTGRDDTYRIFHRIDKRIREVSDLVTKLEKKIADN